MLRNVQWCRKQQQPNRGQEWIQDRHCAGDCGDRGGTLAVASRAPSGEHSYPSSTNVYRDDKDSHCLIPCHQAQSSTLWRAHFAYCILVLVTHDDSLRKSSEQQAGCARTCLQSAVDLVITDDLQRGCRSDRVDNLCFGERELAWTAIVLLEVKTFSSVAMRRDTCDFTAH